MVSRVSLAQQKIADFKKKRTIVSNKDYEGGFGGGFESYASEQDGDAEADQQVRGIFNSKNVQLIEKNQELLDQADDERNEKIRDFV